MTQADEDEEDQEDLEDDDFAPAKASGCVPTGLGCLVLLGFPLAAWLLS